MAGEQDDGRLENMNEELKQRLELLKKKLDLEGIGKEIKLIEAQSANPDFWKDQERAGRAMKKMAGLQKQIKEVEELEKLLSEGKEAEVKKLLDKVELKVFLGGKYDSGEAIFSVHSGQGGVEAMDWAQMLERMYIKYFEKKGWEYEILDLNSGEEAGIKSMTMLVKEPYAYGYLKFEAGTHRLVRQSPFNADKLRQTSFALVEVLPKVEEEVVKVKEEDLEWQFFRSSTQGGQNVQKVSTAVRLKHRPTGIVVTCQTQRQQEQNRKIALSLLQSKLWEKESQEKEKEMKRLKEGRTKASWGTQIRSYVLHPYKLVKDLRTEVETGNPEAVLDGDLDTFIDSEIRMLSSTLT